MNHQAYSSVGRSRRNAFRLKIIRIANTAIDLRDVELAKRLLHIAEATAGEATREGCRVFQNMLAGAYQRLWSVSKHHPPRTACPDPIGTGLWAFAAKDGFNNAQPERDGHGKLGRQDVENE